MTVVEYIREKNKILKDATGIVLVPEDQIVDVDFRGSMGSYFDSGCCPYCGVYAGSGCVGCPMYEAGNGCISEEPKDKTYHQILNILRESKITAISDLQEIKSLISKWNSER